MDPLPWEALHFVIQQQHRMYNRGGGVGLRCSDVAHSRRHVGGAGIRDDFQLDAIFVASSQAGEGVTFRGMEEHVLSSEGPTSSVIDVESVLRKGRLGVIDVESVLRKSQVCRTSFVQKRTTLLRGRGGSYNDARSRRGGKIFLNKQEVPSHEDVEIFAKSHLSTGGG